MTARIAIGLAAAAVLAAPPAALATTVSRDVDTVTVQAAAGERNVDFVVDSSGTLRIAELNTGNGATLVAGSGCVPAPGFPNAVDCGATATLASVIVNTGDLEDVVFPLLTTTVPFTIDGGNGSDQLLGSLGPDSISAGAGNDFVVDQGGNDTISGGVGRDVVIPGLGDDTARGEDGSDVLIEQGGANTLDGGDGSDVIGGGPGKDDQLGGADNDRLMAEGRLQGADVIDGGAGIDNAQAGNEGEPLTLSLDGQPNDGPPGLGANLISIESLAGGQADDTITGSSGPEQLSGGGGRDVISGGGGNDRLFGDEQADTLSGEDGLDSIFGGSGDDVMNGGAGGDLLYGNDGADDLLGGDGRDTVEFGDGDDTGGVNVTLDDQPNDGAQGEGDNAHSDNENIVGTGGDDVLVGGPGPNTISGGDGDDAIVTREGGTSAIRDTALCGDGDDSVLADPIDSLGIKEEHCETVQYGDPAGFGPDLDVDASGRGAGGSGFVALSLGCPFTARGGCAGTATLTVGGKRAGGVSFSLAPGDSTDRQLRLRRAARRAIRRRGHVNGTLAVAAEDAIGATSSATQSVTLTR